MAPGTCTLRVDVAPHGRSCTVRLGGTIDAATAHRLIDLGRTTAVAGARFVTIDLAAVGLVDVTGWPALRSLAADLSDRGITVTQIGSRASYDRLDGTLLELDTCRRRPTRPTCSAAWGGGDTTPPRAGEPSGTRAALTSTPTTEPGTRRKEERT